MSHKGGWSFRRSASLLILFASLAFYALMAPFGYAILAMVAGGVAVFALPRFQDSQKKTAEAGARTIRMAVQQWQAANNETSCPTISQLIQDKQLDTGQNTNDPWGNAYSLSCTDDEVTVLSNGPDKKKGSKDDIAVPKAQAAQAE